MLDKCPENHELLDFLLGKSDSESVGEHLAQCELCRQRMLRLDQKSDPLVAGLQRTFRKIQINELGESMIGESKLNPSELDDRNNNGIKIPPPRNRKPGQ